MLLLFPLEVVQASLLSSVFSVDKYELLILGEVCEIGAFVFAGVILFLFLFKSIFLWGIWHFFQIF